MELGAGHGIRPQFLRYAAENGYDKLTWDTGATAADRFDLSKLIRRVVYEPAGPNYAAKEEGGCVITPVSTSLRGSCNFARWHERFSSYTP